MLELDPTTAVDRYLAALNEPDAGLRRQCIAAAWAPDGGITDPPLIGQGHDGVAELGEALHAHYAGHAFRRTSEVDGHHGRFRVAWALTGPDGAIAVTGLDVGELLPDGRVGQVVGFFGETAAEARGRAAGVTPAGPGVGPGPDGSAVRGSRAATAW